MTNHTPGDWSIETAGTVHLSGFDPQPTKAIVKKAGNHKLYIAFVPIGDEYANAELLVRAPALLAENARLREALKPFAVLHISDCDSCEGTGFRRGDKSCKDACNICGGTGELVSATLPEDVRKARAALAVERSEKP